MAFLNKANQDADEGRAAAQSSRGGAGQQRTFKTADEGSELPKSIAEVIRDAVYVSEADEPFKGVSLKWKGEGGLPDEGQLYLGTSFQDDCSSKSLKGGIWKSEKDTEKLIGNCLCS